MNHKKRIILTVLAVVAGVIGFVVFRLPPDPVYEGKHLSEWLRAIPNHYPPIDENKELLQALQHMGTNAIPFLVQEIRCHDSRFKLAVMELAEKQKYIKLGFATEELRHHRAFFAFECVGTQHKTASIQALAPFLDNPELIFETMVAMHSIDAGNWRRDEFIPEALPFLINTMTNLNPAVRYQAIYSMGMGYCKYHILIPALITHLKDPDAKIRLITIQTLYSYPSMPVKDIISAIVENLQNANAGVRRDAATDLNMFRLPKLTKSAVPFLVKNLNDPDAEVRAATTNALESIYYQIQEKQ